MQNIENKLIVLPIEKLPGEKQRPFDLTKLNDITFIQNPCTIVEINKLIESCKEIECVETKTASVFAIGYIKQLKAFIKSADDSRKSIKKPIDEVIRRLQEFYKNSILAASEEVARLEKINNAWVTAECERVAEENRKAEIELQRLNAEKERLENLSAATKNVAEAEKIQSQMASIERSQEKVLVTAQVSIPPKIAGTRSRTIYEFEITDLNALYAFNKSFVTLAPVNVQIRMYIEEHFDEIQSGKLTIPGLSNIKKTKAVS